MFLKTLETSCWCVWFGFTPWPPKLASPTRSAWVQPDLTAAWDNSWTILAERSPKHHILKRATASGDSGRISLAEEEEACSSVFLFLPRMASPGHLINPNLA